jgi:N-acyl-D-aspartate/D-glutamate deacylase
MSEFDVIIQNASIVDGSGKSAYRGSIGVKGDKVVAVGDVKGDAKEVIDASKLTAVPGFIDSHSHGDLSLPYYPRCENYVLQGVTTFIGGQCGMALAPIGDMVSVPERVRKYFPELSVYKYYPQRERAVLPRAQVNEFMKKEYGWTIDWYTMGDYFNFLEKKGVSINYAPVAGHNAIRRLVMGEDYMRHSNKVERAQMAGLIRQGLDDGCIGMSVGLDYEPDVFASRDEIIEHAAILKEYDAIFAPHSRRTDRRRDIEMGHRLHNKIDGLNEIIDICRGTKGVRMNIAHLYTGWYIQPQDGPAILEETNHRATLMVIDEALKEGLDISFDVIPSALPTRFGGWSYLCGTWSPWTRELGSRENFAKWLKVPEFRAEVKDAFFKGKIYLDPSSNPNVNPQWAKNYWILEHKNKTYENKSIAQIAKEQGKDPLDTWFDLIVEDPDAKSATGGGDPEAPYHAIFFQHPASAVGLDTNITEYPKPKPPEEKPGTPEKKPETPERPPGSISTFSAYVGFFDKFVKRQKALTLEQAVHKTSTQVAIRYKLKGRGIIKEGNYADIVLMDFANLKITATALNPAKQPEGIEYVFVNGVAVVKNAKHTGAMPGRILKRE